VHISTTLERWSWTFSQPLKGRHFQNNEHFHKCHFGCVHPKPKPNLTLCRIMPKHVTRSHCAHLRDIAPRHHSYLGRRWREWRTICNAMNIWSGFKLNTSRNHSIIEAVSIVLFRWLFHSVSGHLSENDVIPKKVRSFVFTVKYSISVLSCSFRRISISGNTFLEKIHPKKCPRSPSFP